MASAQGILSNGSFTGSLAGWTAEGIVFNTGNQAVFSDSVATPTALFQTVAVGAEFAGFQISFDVLTGGLSPTLSPGFLLDSFFATVYLGSSAFGPAIDGAAFDEAFGLFDQDRSGFFNVAAGATFASSPKGAGWTRYTLTMATAGLFEGEGFLTVAFQFFNQNGIGSDSTAAVDNVVAKVISAPLRWRLPGSGVWDVAATANWVLLTGGADRVFETGVQAVFDGSGGSINVSAPGVEPGSVTVTTGGYLFSGAPISGLTPLLKSGTGLLVIDSANTYSGGTVVTGDAAGDSGLDCFCRGGVLEALFCDGGLGTAAPGSALWVTNEEGSATGSGPVQVGENGFVGGVGSIAGEVTLNGGAGGRARLVPGGINEPVTREVLKLGNNLTVADGGEVVFRLGERGHTAIEVEGDVAVEPGGRIRVVLEEPFIPQAGASFALIELVNGLLDITLAEALVLPPGIAWDTSEFASDGVLKVRGTPPALVILQHPRPVTARPGGDAVFTVEAAGVAPLLYQWEKDGVPIPGEVAATLMLSAVDPGDEADYRCKVTAGATSLHSDAAGLLVRDFPVITSLSASVQANVGDQVEFNVTATGPGTLTFVWQRNEVNLPDPPHSDTVTILSAALSDAGRYRVIVSNDFGSVTSETRMLSFPPAGVTANARPEITHIGDLPPGRVGVSYSYLIPLRADDPDGQIQRQPTRITCSGLPRGLRCVAGVIEGVPLVARAAPYQITMTATNARGTSVIRAALRIDPLEAGLTGTYAGLVGRKTEINSGLGGTVTLKVAASAAFSGAHDEGGRRRPFKGSFGVSATSPGRVQVMAPIPRPGSVIPHQLNFILDAVSGRWINGSLTDGSVTVPVAAWRNPWSRAKPATALAGYHTATLGWREQTDAANQTLPQGFGTLTVTVNSRTGAARAVGLVMDKSGFTVSTFAGPNGQVLLFRALYARAVRGSLIGMVVLTPMALNADNTLTGCVGWNRPANPAIKNRFFRDGFTERFLDVAGGRYTPPAQRILGLTDVANQAQLTFSGAGLDSALPAQGPTTFTLSTKNKATFTIASNPRNLKFSVVGRTGLFKGTFMLRQNNPLLLPDREVPVTRRVSYQGILPGKDLQGAGFALVPQLPAVEGETPGNTIHLGTGVLLEPANPP